MSQSYKDGGKLTKLFKGICGYFHFAKVLLVDRPDIVHMHSSFGPSFYRSLPFIYMAFWAKKPMINHIHGSEFDKLYTNASERKKKLVRKAWGKCNRFIVLSESWKERFSEVIPNEKMTVIENYSIVKDGINRSQCHNQVLFLGAINQMKGCYDIVDVTKRVAEVVSDIKMVVAGAGEIEQVKSKATAEGVARHFVFPGWVRGKQKGRSTERERCILSSVLYGRYADVSAGCNGIWFTDCCYQCWWYSEELFTRARMASCVSQVIRLVLQRR